MRPVALGARGVVASLGQPRVRQCDIFIRGRQILEWPYFIGFIGIPDPANENRFLSSSFPIEREFELYRTAAYSRDRVVQRRK
jgi:hypothetical protein